MIRCCGTLVHMAANKVLLMTLNELHGLFEENEHACKGPAKGLGLNFEA